MDLFLVRHGAAEGISEAQGIDARRSLTEAGKADISCVAAALKRLEIRPRYILTSPYLRAEQTAQILADGLDVESKTSEPTLACGASPETFLAALEAAPSPNGVMIVAHNPDLEILIASLISAEGGARATMRPGTVARLDLSLRGARSSARLLGLWSAEHLVALSRGK